MSKPLRPNISRPDSGFTLIEALVSLAIVAMTLAALETLAATSHRSGLYIERHLGDVDIARTAFTGLPARDRLAPGALNGEIGDRQWRVDVAPFVADFIDPNARTPWTPEWVALRVQAPGGTPLQFETVRLRKKGAP